MPNSDPRPPLNRSRGAGGPFFLVLVAATVIGFLFGQATIGFLIGLALGAALALVLWRGDRWR